VGLQGGGKALRHDMAWLAATVMGLVAVAIASFFGGYSPLHVAAMFAPKGVVAALVVAGLDTGAKSSNGNSPLHFAASWGREDVVGLLLEKGADMHAIDRGGKTPLHLSTFSMSLDAAMDTLLAAGADKEKKDVHGKPYTVNPGH